MQAKLSEVKDELRRRMHDPNPGSRPMVAGGRWWTHPLLRSAHERLRAGGVPASDRLALAPSALAPQPERPRPLGQNTTLDRPLAASRTRISSLSTAPHGVIT